mgnify:FL=1
MEAEIKMKAMRCHHQAEVNELRNNPKLAQAYLQEAMQWIDQPDGRAVSLMVLRALAQSHGGMTQIAKEAGIERQSLYRALSPNGNPTLNTLIAVMRAVGMRLSVEPLDPKDSQPVSEAIET